jgi:hypothetical protein
MSRIKVNDIQGTSGTDSAITLSGDAVTVNGAFTSQGIDDNATSTAITIDSSENVGIGTTSGTAPLEVSGSSQNVLRVHRDFATNSASSATIRFAGDDSAGNVTDYAEIRSFTEVVTDGSEKGALLFGTRESGSITERMRITSAGLVGINATSPSAMLHATSPNMASAYDALRVQNASNNTGGYFIRFVNYTNGVAGYVEQTGSTTVAYRTSSDHRLKENVVTMTGAIDRVKQLLPKRFNFIEDGTDTVVDGFLAHEAQTVVPEAVGGTHNEVDDDGNPVYQGIDQAKLVPLLTGALKEAIAKIEALETRIETLENA